MSRSFNYFINTSFFISVYKITVCTSTQKWFTKSTSSVPMLRKIEHILNCLHVRRKRDNAPYHKVLNTLNPQAYRHVMIHTGHTWSESQMSTTKIFLDRKALEVPFVFLFPLLSIVAEEKSLKSTLQKVRESIRTLPFPWKKTKHKSPISNINSF